MNLHEYQGKALFAEYGLPVSVGQAVDTPEAAEKQITEMCEKLLANTVIENYDIQLNLAD